METSFNASWYESCDLVCKEVGSVSRAATEESKHEIVQ